MKKLMALALSLVVLLSAGCTVPAAEGLFESGGSSQLRLRQIQTRYFDTSDKQRTVEAVIATLQDLGFVIDKAPTYDKRWSDHAPLTITYDI